MGVLLKEPTKPEKELDMHPIGRTLRIESRISASTLIYIRESRDTVVNVKR